MYSLVIIFLVFMIMKCGASVSLLPSYGEIKTDLVLHGFLSIKTQNSAHLTIFKRSDFRGEFKQTSVAISAAQLKVEAAKTKAKKEKEGTEMHTKQPGLRLDKSERKGYLPPEHLSRKTPPGMKQLKNKGKAIESR